MYIYKELCYFFFKYFHKNFILNEPRSLMED